jgi:3-hydroxyisobutyrate dehydrogenase-like beta-hydroxyacid dehydrogenase
MKIRIIGAGHDVKVANSRGPETIQVDVLASSGRTVTAAEAAADLEVVTLFILQGCLSEARP